MIFSRMCVRSGTVKDINCGDQTGSNFDAASVSPSLCIIFTLIQLKEQEKRQLQ